MEAVNGGMLGEDKGGPPPPSPLTGCYLLVVVGEPHSGEHKDIILQRVAKGLLSWDVNNCLVDLEKELSIITDQGLEGEEARYGERLIQFASENLVTEILIHPAVSTLSQCVRNLLSSFTRHRHVIHAGYTFQGNGSWAVQDGTFSYSDFSEAFQEIDVQRVIHAYENGISLDLHCSPEGDWTRLPKETFTKACKVRINPTDVLTTGSPAISNFIKYLAPFLVPTSLENVLESSDVVGNIRFSRPTLYVFPGGQGDAALFGINGFNMLLDGGYSRKACFWDFVRHLDRLDAVLMTRLNNSSICGISSVLKRKRQGAVYPQVGHFFCNFQERKSLLSPDGDKDKDPLIFSILEEGQSIVQDLQHLNLNPQSCYRDQEPIILYHKVGHGTLNMYVLSPDKNSREVREFLQKWNQSDSKMFAGTRGGRDFSFPLQNLVSICALLVWQPANPNDTITRILYPGSTPQKKIFEGFDRLKNLECIKHPLCSEKSLAPVKKSKQEVLDKLASKDRVMSEKRPENKLIEDAMKNGEVNGDVVREKQVKKSNSLESDKEKKTKKVEEKKVDESKKAEKIEDVEKIVENEEKVKAKPKSGDAKPLKKRGDSQHRKKPAVEKKGPTTPKKTVENKTNGETKDKEKDKKAPQKPSPSATPAKSTKDANNRRVIENKKTLPKKEPATKSAPPAEAKTKPERKPISRRPKTIKGPPSPMKKMTNGVQKPDSISKRGKVDKEGTTDSSTVSTPSADQDSILKKDLSKLTPEEIQQLKDKELDELKEEQEAVKEIEAVFRKGEGHVEEAEHGIRKIKDMSIDDNLDTEEYLIIEKEEIEHDSLDQETKEDEMQKLARDSEESEKQRKLSSEEKEIDIQIENQDLPVQEIISKEDVPAKTFEDTESRKRQISSPEDKGTPTTDKKELADEEVKEIVESQPEEKVSANVESGATTTAPTLPEDERITLDDIKEDNGQPIEEKHVKEETKEKEVPVIQLPPQSQQDSQAKMPLNVGISLDKQKHIRDIVKTPDEVADLPVHEEADFHEFHGDGKKNNEPDIGNEQTKEDKKIEEKKDDKESIDESKGEVREKEKDVGEIQPDEKLPKEVPSEVKGEEKGDEDANKIDDLEEIAEKEIHQQQPKKEVIEELLDSKDLTKIISKDIKTESQTFLDQEKAANDFDKQEHVQAPATDDPIIIEKAVAITQSSPEKSVEKAEKTQKFEILEKAELETKEKVEGNITLLEEKLKESIDDEWVVITKEEKDHDKVETAQEAEKEMKDRKEDLKELLTDEKNSESLEKHTEPDNYKQNLKDEFIEEHEQPKPKEKALSGETKEEDKISEEKVVPKEDVLTELSTPPKTEDTDIKEKETENECECDDHDIRKEDEIQEILEKDNEDIKALIEEADTKILKDYDHQEPLDDAKNAIEKSEITEARIAHTKATNQEVVIINDKIQELKKDIHEPVEEISFSRTKRDLTKIEESVYTDLKEDVEKLAKIDDKLQELKHSVEEMPIEKAEVKIEKSTKSPEHAEQVTLPDSSPDESEHLTFGDLEIDKIELGRKSPAEREEDVKKIVVSVAEVLKSEAPLEEFQGKLPFTQELRETHITTQDSPIIEAKVIITDDIPPIPEEPTESTEEPTDIIDRRKDLIAGAQELMAASSKVISDIKSKTEEKVDKVEEELEKIDDKLKDKDEKDVQDNEKIHREEEIDNNEEKYDNDDDSGTVHRMLVTASSEDGGEEIEICPVGTIIFSKSSESSGRSSPEPSQKTHSQKSSIVETLSDTLSTVKQITEKDLDIEKEGVEDPSDEKPKVLDSIEDAIDSATDLVKEKIEEISSGIHKMETDVEEDISDIIKTSETLTQDSKDEIKDEAKKVKVEIKQTQDGIEDLISGVKAIESDIKQEVNEASKKVDDKATEVLGTVSSKVEELSEKAKNVNAEVKSVEEENIKVTKVLDSIQQDISKDADKTLSESKDTKESVTDQMHKISEQPKEISDETTKELKEKVDEGTLKTEKEVTSAADDTVLKMDDVSTKLEEHITASAIDKVKEVDKCQDIFSGISGSTEVAKETIQNKVENACEKIEDEVKEKIKDVKDETLEKSQEILTNISSSNAELKESIGNKTDVALKMTQEVEELIKEEIKDLKDETVDKSKEIVADFHSTIADTKQIIENKTDDTLKTTEEFKDRVKETTHETVDKSKEMLTGISDSVVDTIKTIEDNVSDALQASEEVQHLLKQEIKDNTREILSEIAVASGVKDATEVSELIKDEIKEVKDETIAKPNEIVNDISGSIVDTRETITIKVSDTSDEVKDLTKEEVKSPGESKVEELVGKSEKLAKKLESDLSQTKNDTKHELYAKEPVVGESKDLQEKSYSTSAQTKDFGEITEEQDTQKIADDGSEDLKQIADKLDNVVKAKDDVAKEVDEAIVDENKEYAKIIGESVEVKFNEIKNDILTKVEAVVTESSEIDNKKVKEVVDDKVKVGEAKISDLNEVIKEQSQGDNDKCVEIVDNIPDKVENNLEKVKDIVVETRKDVTDKIGDLSATVLDVTEKIEETIGIKAEGIDKTAKFADSEKNLEEKVEDKLTKEEADRVRDEQILAKAEIKESTPERRNSVIEQAEQLLEKSEQVIGSVFSAISDAANLVVREISPEPKISDSETKSDKAIVEHLTKEGPAEYTRLDSTLDPTTLSAKTHTDVSGKEELISSLPAISGKSTSELPKKESENEDEKIEDSKKLEGDISALVTEVAKTTDNTIDSRIVDIEENTKEKDTKIMDKVKDLTIKTEHDVAKENLESEKPKITDTVVAVEAVNETLAESKETKRDSVVEKAEEFLDKAEKTIVSTVTAIGDATKSILNDILPDPKTPANEIKLDEDHFKNDILEKFDAAPDSTEPSGKSSPDKSRKGTSVETSPGISGKSTPDSQTDKITKETEKLKEKSDTLQDELEAIKSAPDSQTDKTTKETEKLKEKSDTLQDELEAIKSAPDSQTDKTTKESEKLKEKSDTLQDELEAIKSGVLETEDQKVEASDKFSKKTEVKDGDKTSSVKSVDLQEHGLIDAAEEFIEKSETAVKSIFSAIEEAAKSIIPNASTDKEKGSEEKYDEQKEKTNDKKENLQHEEKEIEDKSTPFDAPTSDKSKVDKENSEKKIEDYGDVIFEKGQPSDGFKVVSEKADKQTKELVSNLEHSVEVDDLSKSISFDKCHISKEDKLVQKEADILEYSLEKVSDMTQPIVLEKDKQTFDASTTERKETTSSSDVVIDSNKLGNMESASYKFEKEELVHEEQEKKDPEKEHIKLEDKVEEKLEVAKQVKNEFEENIKTTEEPSKQNEQPVEVLKDFLECDMTKSVYVEKNDSSPESHKLDDNISETSKPEKSADILKTDDTSVKAKDIVVLEDQHISSQTEKCEKESMEKTLSEKDSSSLKVERTEPKKLSISDVEISIKTEECTKDASRSFLDNERALFRDNIDAKVYVCPVSSQEDNKASVDEASSSSILQAAAEAPALSDKSSPDLELSGKTTPPTVPVSPIAKEVKSSSSKLDSGLSEHTETDDEDLSTKSQVAHSQSDLDELDMKMDPMSISFYGSLPGEQGEGSEEVPATLLYEITKAKFATELKQEDQESEKKVPVDLMTASFIGELPSAPSDSRPIDPKEDVSKKDAVDSWGKPLGLPAPTYLYEVTKAKFSSSTEDSDLMTSSFIGDTLPTSSLQNRTQEKAEPNPMTTSVYFEHSSDSGYDPIASWGKPLGLPSPAPPNNNEKGTPKKERKLPAYVTAKNKLNDDKKRADSPSKLKAKKINPVYMDLTYVPHHGNHNYSYVDFFKKIRARYYVFSGLEPSRQVYDALLEAKQTWEDKELEVTIIPTYDTDILGYWVAENEELLSKFKIDLSPSASRCTINLQDHETSCSAYRLEF